MKNQTLIAGNWKMNGSLELCNQFSNSLSTIRLKKHIEILICPPFPYLLSMYRLLKGTNIKVGGQDCHHSDGGAFTGSVDSKMLAECGASYVILGHSERRQLYYSENKFIFQKVLRSFESNLIPIICVGEDLESRNNNETKKVLQRQLNAILRKELRSKEFVIAYEPLWAIGTGKVASNLQIADVHKFIRDVIRSKLGEQTADHTKILYGGSVKPDNCKEILDVNDVNGALIGGASLRVNDFLEILA